jgi:hypothetical protein
LVFVTTSGGTTAIYNLFDSTKGAVTIALSTGIVDLPPGRAIILSKDGSLDLDQSNPVWSIGHRELQTSTTGGAQVTTAEFSIPSALAQVGSLAALLRSKDPRHKKLAQRLFKTVAVLMTVKKNGLPYRPIAKRPLLSANP